MTKQKAKTVQIRINDALCTPLEGGAWKVAYADFVTAMMAFFLLLWLLNVTTQEEKDAISNYFDPTHKKVSESQSGAGGVLGGLSVAPQGAMTQNIQTITNPNPQAPNSPIKSPAKPNEAQKDTTEEKVRQALERQEQERFEQAEEALKKAIEEDPDLSELAENIMIDITEEGLRIQIIDQEKRPMFALGSAEMYAYTKALMGKIATVINKMSNALSIRGHTDSIPYGTGADYTNWELSSDRANSTRRALKTEGIAQERLNNVMGKADTEPLLPDDPKNAQNRRISIILLKESLTNRDYAKTIAEKAQDQGFLKANNLIEKKPAKAAPYIPPPGTFKRSRGKVEFP